MTHPRLPGSSLVSALAADVKYASRFLRRHRGFTTVAAGTLAVGIGMGTATFSAEYATALRPLPYPRADRIVQLRAVSRQSPDDTSPYLSVPIVGSVESGSRALDAVGAALPVTVTVRTASSPELVSGHQVSGGYFDVYGTAPMLGRAIGPADAAPGAGRVVVLGHALWQRLFGGAPDIIGRRLDLAVAPSNIFMPWTAALEPYVVVGVMPAADRFPIDDGLWVPLDVGWGTPDARMKGMGSGPQITGPVTVVARLRDGVSIATARTELRTIGEQWLHANPGANGRWLIDVVGLRDATIPDYATAVLLLVAAVNAVLVLACVSLGGLLAARTRARCAELAVREALGASRRRLVQQLLVESTMLAVTGGAGGLLLALASERALKVLAPASMIALRALTLEWPVLSYAAAVCLAGGVAIGLLPALHLMRSRRPPAMRLADGLTGSTRRTGRARGALVAVQIALVFPLVTGAALALRSFDRLVNVDVGYRTDHILVMNVKPSASRCPPRHFDACLATIDALLDRERALPGVASAAVTGARPFDISNATATSLDGTTANPILAEFGTVTPDYFKTMGVPLKAGRAFDARDTEHAPSVTVVNETFARQSFGGHAVGQRLAEVNRPHPLWLDIVGVVADANDRNLTASPMPAFYLPLAQSNLVLRTTLLIRTAGDPSSLGSAAAAVVSGVDPDAPVTNIDTLDQVVSATTAGARFNTALLDVFAAFGLLVALLGTYGLVAYSVGERHREFGVRRAVGASSFDLARLIVGEGLWAVGGGVAAGVGVAVAAGRWYQSQLFAISPNDPATLAVVAALVLAVAALAYGLPARRATQVDPVVVLRSE